MQKDKAKKTYNTKNYRKRILMMEKEVGKILCTTEYSKFKKIKGNRKINFKNLGKIINSMKKKQLIIIYIQKKCISIFFQLRNKKNWWENGGKIPKK